MGQIQKNNFNKIPLKNDIYSFVSYNDQFKNVEYGHGTVEIVEVRKDGATVKVLTNLPHNTFIGKLFKVNSLNENEILQLFSEDGLEQDIWVTIKKELLDDKE